jgi:hypothetical protein
VRGRFDIVVFNFKRLELFAGGFHRFSGLDPARDRVTIVSASPSQDERRMAAELHERIGIPVRYLTRRNRGLGELGRAEYFTGAIGDLEANLSHRFVFQMQDHYLAPEDPSSRWGPELDHGMKSDVVPDGVSFDLERMERLADEHDVEAFVADRSRGCYMEIGSERFMAPSGGNFGMAADRLRRPDVQMACRRLIATCDNTYTWARYAEYKWGQLLFPEGTRTYNLVEDRLMTEWRPEQLYVSPDNYRALFARYDDVPPSRQAVRRAGIRLVQSAAAVLRR